MPTGLKHSESMVEVTARPRLTTDLPQRHELSVKAKIGVNISQVEGRSRHLDIYSRSFSRASRQSREAALKRIKLVSSLNMTRMAIKHESRNPNQAQTYHVLTPYASESHPAETMKPLTA